MRRMVEACIDKQVKVLTLFAFSSENWRRPDEEVSLIMDLFVQLNEAEGMTVIIITHDFDVAGQCRRVLQMKGGQLDETGGRR